MTCACTPGACCLHCAEIEADPHPFLYIGELMAADIEERGRRAYGTMWADTRARLLHDHSDGRAEFARALYIDEGLAVLAEMEAAHPEVFTMTRRWKDPDRYKPKPREKKPRRAWFPEVPDDAWIGVPDPPRIVHVSQPHDLRIADPPFANPYPADPARYRQHLAHQILSGAITHAQLVEAGRRNGWNGVRLGAAPDDCHAETVARCIMAAGKHSERAFLFLIRKHFTKGEKQ